MQLSIGCTHQKPIVTNINGDLTGKQAEATRNASKASVTIWIFFVSSLRRAQVIPVLFRPRSDQSLSSESFSSQCVLRDTKVNLDNVVRQAGHARV